MVTAQNRICHFPECESYCEGSTDYCSTHNFERRKAQRPIKDDRKAKIKKFSEKRIGQLTIYSKQVRTWLIGKRCICCGDPATECHHAAGRENDLLLTKKWWKPVCRPCHILITEDSAWAIREGYSISRTKTTQP